MRYPYWMSLVLPGLVACRDGGGHSWRAALRDYARPDTVERLHVALDGERARGDAARRLSKDLAEKNDYLLAQLNDLARIVNDIDRDLGGTSRAPEVRPLVPTGEVENAQSDRELFEAKRKRIAANIGRLNSRLHTTDSLLRKAASENSAARTALASSTETLEMFRTLAENRAVQFTEFEERIDSLQIANRALADERDRMRDSLSHVSSRVSRVYYVVGTRDELLNAGIVHEVTVVKKLWKGWQREKQLIPAREAELVHLAMTHTSAASLGNADDTEADVEQQGAFHSPDNGEFRELDRFRDTLLALPSARRARMRVVSAQELRYADGVGRDGRVNSASGRLRIMDPEGFWEGGRFLVLMIER